MRKIMIFKGETLHSTQTEGSRLASELKSKIVVVFEG